MKEPTGTDTTLLLFLGIYSATLIAVVIVATSLLFGVEQSASVAAY